MKRGLLACALLLMVNLALAQAPQGIPYQAVARNSSGALLASTAIRVRYTIHDSIATGAMVYRETFNPTTTSQGLFSLNVGTGTVVSGTFSSINWGTNAKFMQVEIDPTGGSSYIDMGTQQMMSVPYALYAGSANSSTYGLDSSNLLFNIGISHDSIWTCPVGVTQIVVQLWGGGAGGGGGSYPGCSYSCPCYAYCGVCVGGVTLRGNTTCGRGGNGGVGGIGGYIMQRINVVPMQTYSIIIGAGGIGGAGGTSAGGSNGMSGGATRFASILTADGGAGGYGGGNITGCDLGGNGTNGAVINFSPVGYPSPISTSPRSYIPGGYLTSIIVPSIGAQGGIGGNPGSYQAGLGTAGWCASSSNASAGANGENGYCVISY